MGKVVNFLLQRLSLIYGVVFLMLVTLLLGLFIFERVSGYELRRVDLNENRQLAFFPEFSATDYSVLPVAIEQFFNDNLPLRTQIIYKYRKICKFFFDNDSALIVGTSGGYYSKSLIFRLLKMKREDILPNFYAIRSYLMGMNYFWRSHGAEYLFAFIPEKNIVEESDLPLWARKRMNWSRELEVFLRNSLSFNVDFVNFSDVLSSYTKGEQVFNKNFDIVHWNGYGLDAFNSFILKKYEKYSFWDFNNENDAYRIIKLNKKTSDLIGTSETVPWLQINSNNLEIVNNRYFRGFKHHKADWQNTDVVYNHLANRGSLFIMCDSYLKLTHQDVIPGAHSAVSPLAHNVRNLIMSHFFHVTVDFIREVQEEFMPDLVITEAAVNVSNNFAQVNHDTAALFVAGEMLLKDSALFITPQMLSQKNAIGDSNALICVGKDGKIIDLPPVRSNSDGRICVMAYIYSSITSRICIY